MKKNQKAKKQKHQTPGQKARQERVKRQLALQRKVHDAEKKKERELAKNEHIQRKLAAKGDVIPKGTFVKPEKREEIVKDRVAKNLAVLKELEAKYEEEMGKKLEINKELEAAGAITIRDKLDLMEEKAKKVALEQANEAALLKISQASVEADIREATGGAHELSLLEAPAE